MYCEFFERKLQHVRLVFLSSYTLLSEYLDFSNPRFFELLFRSGGISKNWDCTTMIINITIIITKILLLLQLQSVCSRMYLFDNLFNPFWAVPFLYPLKTSENLCVFYVFRGNRNRTSVEYGLIKPCYLNVVKVNSRMKL